MRLSHNSVLFTKGRDGIQISSVEICNGIGHVSIRALANHLGQPLLQALHVPIGFRL